MRIASLFAVTAVGAFLAACGQKGPLVLPDAQHPHKKLGFPKPAASPAPQPGTPSAPSSTPANTGHNDNGGDATAVPAPQQ